MSSADCQRSLGFTLPGNIVNAAGSVYKREIELSEPDLKVEILLGLEILEAVAQVLPVGVFR